jgi:hypothetical protein
MKTTVRDFHSHTQLDGGKTYFDLPVIFEGTVDECHDFCKDRGLRWMKSDNIFGGYYVDESGKCLMLF